MRFLPISKLVIHHSAGGSWESILKYHEEKGWGDKSAYHWFVEKDGVVRAGRDEADYSPATQSWIANHSGIHICVDGSFDQEEPSQEQLNTLKKMVQAKMKIYGIKPENVIGHRDVNVTVCPGDNLYSKLSAMADIIPEWAEEISLEMARAGVSTRPAENIGNIPLYQHVLLIKKMLIYWKVLK